MRGHHVYKANWTPQHGETLTLEREPTNAKDKFAIAVMKERNVVGHLPYNLAPTVSAFLKRTMKKGMAVVTGERVNRGAGYGLEGAVYLSVLWA